MSSPQDGQQHPEYGQAYDPYGGRDPYNNRGFDIPYPAGGPGAPQAPQPVTRPGVVIGAFVLQLLGTLPWVLGALGVLLSSVTSDAITSSGVLDAPEVKAAGLTADTLLTAIHAFAVVVLVLAVLYGVFAALAFAGRNWARILVAVLTGVFVLLLLLVVLAGGGTQGGGLLVLFVALPAVGVALMFTAAANAWFASLRR